MGRLIQAAHFYALNFTIWESLIMTSDLIRKVLVAGVAVAALSAAACSKPAEPAADNTANAAAPAENAMAPGNAMAPADNMMAPAANTAS